jgi:transcriptional regulator of arginine metabolism
VAEYVTGADTAGNLVVIRTPAASAQPVAIAIDGAQIDGVLGTIGGDDTIFVAFRSTDAATAFAGRLRRIIGVGRRNVR